MTKLRNTIPEVSEYVYENFNASLNNGEGIDSGWIDMESYDKYQFEGIGTVVGMTMIISSSSIDGGGRADDITSPTISTELFQLLNLPCRQRFMRFQWVNNTGNIVNNCSLAIKTFRGGSDRLSVFPLSTRPKNFSQAALTQSVLLGKDASGEFQNALVNKGGALVSTDFFTEVAQNNIEGHLMGSKFGRNPRVDILTAPEDLSGIGGIYTGQPVGFTPELVEVLSSNNNDSITGTGARAVRIMGLKSPTSENIETEDIILNGTTPVQSVNTWWRVFDSFVLIGGSVGSNLGNITVRAATTNSVVFDRILTGFNQSALGAITVPANKYMIVKRVRLAISRANGSAGSATITLRIRGVGGVYRAIRVFEMQTGAALNYTVLGGEMIPQGADLKVTVDDVSDNNTAIEGAIEYILIDN